MKVLTRFLMLIAISLPLAALAQPYPVKPLKLVTQFTAGGSGDTTLRIFAAPFSEILGQPVLIDNRAGAGGVVAAEAVARAPADGYTLLAGTSSTQVIRRFLAKNLSFDPVKDFVPVSQLIEEFAVIAVHPSVPVDSFKELIDYAKRNPGKLSYGTSGVGSEHHLSGEQIKQLTGADMVHVPYKASSQALLDVVGGQLPVTFAMLALARPFIASGKVRALALVMQKRFAGLPSVPTVSEVLPDFDPPPSWIGLFAPAGLPDNLLRRLNADVLKAMSNPAARSKFAEAGQEVSTSSPEEFAARLKRETALVGRIVKAAGITPE
jgi:tripartite-type tricarboxylate transporter receptor subunit TctC